MFNENVNAYEQLQNIGITDKDEQELVLNYFKTLVNIVLTLKKTNNE